MTIAACGEAAAPPPTPSSSSTPAFTPPPPSATPPLEATQTPAPAVEPRGFPIDPALRLGLVTADRTIQWGAGSDALTYSRADQPSDDAQRANRSGWNCRVHLEYEGQPAVDWYLPIGTPIHATMDGTATLYAITMTNAFDYYGVDRAPYIGNPDGTNAPIVPFPGPGGGKGVFVRIENKNFTTEYAHLDLGQTAAVPPDLSFLPGYTASSNFGALFVGMRDFREATPIAQWSVRRGDLVGMSGDAGYSEAPHLHYTVRRAAPAALLCPTAEEGFPDGGWLFR